MSYGKENKILPFLLEHFSNHLVTFLKTTSNLLLMSTQVISWSVKIWMNCSLLTKIFWISAKSEKIFFNTLSYRWYKNDKPVYHYTCRLITLETMMTHAYNFLLYNLLMIQIWFDHSSIHLIWSDLWFIFHIHVKIFQAYLIWFDSLDR